MNRLLIILGSILLTVILMTGVFVPKLQIALFPDLPMTDYLSELIANNQILRVRSRGLVANPEQISFQAVNLQLLLFAAIPVVFGLIMLNMRELTEQGRFYFLPNNADKRELQLVVYNFLFTSKGYFFHKNIFSKDDGGNNGENISGRQLLQIVEEGINSYVFYLMELFLIPVLFFMLAGKVTPMPLIACFDFLLAVLFVEGVVKMVVGVEINRIERAGV